MKKVLSLLFEASGGKECPKDENSKEPSYRPCGFTERDPTKIKETKLQVSILLACLTEIMAFYIHCIYSASSVKIYNLVIK